MIAGSSSHDRPPSAEGAWSVVQACWWRRRADGSLVYEIKLRQDGVLHSTTLATGTTARDARTAWKKASAKRDDGGRPMTRNVRLDEVAALALIKLDAEARVGIKSERTATMYRSHYKRFIAPSLGRKRLAKISGSDVVTLIGRLREAGYAEWSINGVATVLRHILRFARPELMAHNPFALLGRSDLPQQRPRQEFEARVLRVDEVDKLVASATPAFRNVAAVAAYCGLRASEIAGLIWEDVSFVDGCIHVRAQLAPGRKESRQDGSSSSPRRRTEWWCSSTGRQWRCSTSYSASRRRVSVETPTSCSPRRRGSRTAETASPSASPVPRRQRGWERSALRFCVDQLRPCEPTLGFRSMSRRRRWAIRRRSLSAHTRRSARTLRIWKRPGRSCPRSDSASTQLTKR